jgi:hypothetical protein
LTASDIGRTSRIRGCWRVRNSARTMEFFSSVTAQIARDLTFRPLWPVRPGDAKRRSGRKAT